MWDFACQTGYALSQPGMQRTITPLPPPRHHAITPPDHQNAATNALITEPAGAGRSSMGMDQPAFYGFYGFMGEWPAILCVKCAGQGQWVNAPPRGGCSIGAGMASSRTSPRSPLPWPRHPVATAARHSCGRAQPLLCSQACPALAARVHVSAVPKHERPGQVLLVEPSRASGPPPAWSALGFQDCVGSRLCCLETPMA